MTAPDLPDLQALERAAFRKFFDDGLLDVFLGLMLATMPLYAVFDRLFGEGPETTLLYAAFNTALVVALVVARRLLVRPRLGVATPNARRRRRIGWSRLALGGSVLLGLLAWGIFAADRGDGLLAFMPFVWLVNCVVVFGALAHFLDVPRFFAYGFLFGVPLAVDAIVRQAELGPLPLAVTFVLPGLVIVGVGAVKLARFLAAYPPREVEDGA